MHISININFPDFPLPGGGHIVGSYDDGGAGGVGVTENLVSLCMDDLKEEELASDGVMVHTLKHLMKLSVQAEEEDLDSRIDEDFKLKLISPDEVIVKGEDLTGKGTILSSHN